MNSILKIIKTVPYIATTLFIGYFSFMVMTLSLPATDKPGIISPFYVVIAIGIFFFSTVCSIRDIKNIWHKK